MDSLPGPAQPRSSLANRQDTGRIHDYSLAPSTKVSKYGQVVPRIPGLGGTLAYMNPVDAINASISANSALVGDALMEAAKEVVAVARSKQAVVIPTDAASERLIGVALATMPKMFRLADRTRRFDGDTVLLVAGALAGPVGLLEQAAVAARLGAAHVHAAVFCGWADPIVGCESVTGFGASDLASSHHAA